MDCAGRRWRLLRFRALDADDHPVAQTASGTAPRPFVAVEARSIAETVWQAVCPSSPNGFARP